MIHAVESARIFHHHRLHGCLCILSVLVRYGVEDTTEVDSPRPEAPPSAPASVFRRTTVAPELQPQLRLYRRLYIARTDLEEARAIVEEMLRVKIPLPRKAPPTMLLTSLTTALVVAYARPFVQSRGNTDIAERTVPGSILRVLSSNQRALHDHLIEVRHREVAHSDADILEISLKLHSFGDGSISRVVRSPYRRRELRAIHQIIEKIERELDARCSDLRSELPLEVWL